MTFLSFALTDSTSVIRHQFQLCRPLRCDLFLPVNSQTRGTKIQFPLKLRVRDSNRFQKLSRCTVMRRPVRNNFFIYFRPNIALKQRLTQNKIEFKLQAPLKCCLESCLNISKIWQIQNPLLILTSENKTNKVQ